MAGGLIGGMTLVAMTGSAAPAEPITHGLAATPTTLIDERTALAEKETTRSMSRDLVTAVPEPPPVQAAPRLVSPPPTAGMDQTQMNNAAVIVKVGLDLGLPKRALIIGVATAMQESDLHNVASEAVPASLNYPHEGTSTDHDSVGLFQQRPSAGWGTVEQLMRPDYQAGKFFAKLVTIDWADMSLTRAAQTVQVSAYPNAYAKHEPSATAIVEAILG